MEKMEKTMLTLFHKIGSVARFVLLLAVVMGTFAASAMPASAARSLPPTDLGGRLAVYVFDNSSISKGPIYSAAITVSDMTGAVILTGSTDKSGWFNGELKAGKYVVIAGAAGFTGNKDIVGINDGTDTAIKLALNRETVDFKGILTVHSWDAPSPAPMPLAGVLIVVKDASGNVVAKGFTSKSGIFSAALAAGAYKFNATANGYKPTSGEGVVVSNQETVSDIMLSKEAVLGQIQMSVYDGMSSRILPIANATIFVYNVDGQLITKGATDIAGKYGTTLNSGLYVMEVSAVGYQSTRVTAKIDAGQTYTKAVYMYWEPVK
jgi:hypothetical protein